MKRSAFALMLLLAACASPKKTDPDAVSAGPTATSAPAPSAASSATSSAAPARQPSEEAALEENSPGSRLEVRCVRGNDVRNLSILPKDEGCQLHYLKPGSSQIIATAKHDSKHCESVRASIRVKLQAAGFSCR